MEVKAKVVGANGSGTVRTLALLDPGSDSTYCSVTLAERLSLVGDPTMINLSTLGQHKIPRVMTVVQLSVQGTRSREGRSIVLRDVLATSDLPKILASRMARKADVDCWSHLRDLETADENFEGVDLLIGLDNPLAVRPMEVSWAGDDEPYAVRTTLGWTINGPLTPTPVDPVPGARICFTLLGEEVGGNDGHITLEDQVRLFWEMEEPRTFAPEGEGLSVDDRAVLRLWDETVERRGSHYMFPIPFKEDTGPRYDNRKTAERRLGSLRARLFKHPALRERYTGEINKLLELGHAEKVPADQLFLGDRRLWYLPHHPVFNPQKPDKVRVVFDCAATHNGVSLNSQVRQGPDLTNKLLGVLVRFRQEPVAVMADIEAMFHQVQVTDEHKDALRFLWWDEPSLEGRPTTFRMTVHLFGGVWSPSCAAYALRKTFSDYGKGYPREVAHAVKNFYVDDLLLSTTTVTKAVEVVRELPALLRKGGFRLTKWISNDDSVLSTIPMAERSDTVKELGLQTGGRQLSQALGITWDTERDVIAVRVRVPRKPLSKRGILSTYSAVYDPLGMLAPFVIRAKILFQRLCRDRRDWDESLDVETDRAWQLWVSELESLVSFCIPRCYSLTPSSDHAHVELHVFADASELAYGVACYLRHTHLDGEIRVAFIFGKARLAPLKQVSIPRLELCAALLAARVARTLEDELTTAVHRIILWTDSVLVLQYIRNPSRRFRTYVANRVAGIPSLTKPDQWRHVPSQLNPADDASRGLPATELLTGCRWKLGLRGTVATAVFRPYTSLGLL